MENADLPGTRTLSQKLALKMLSMVSMPKVSSVGMGAIVGGNVDMSATGPISLANWKSANGSGICPVPEWLPFPFAKLLEPCMSCAVCMWPFGVCDSWPSVGEGSVFALMRARRNMLYRAGVCNGPAAACSSVLATSFTREMIFDS